MNGPPRPRTPLRSLLPDPDATLLLAPTERHLEAAPPSRAAGGGARTFRDFVARAGALLAPELDAATPYTTRLLARGALARLPEGRMRRVEDPTAQVALACAIDRAVGLLRRAGTTPDHLYAVGTKPALLLADLLADVDDRLGAARLYDERSSAGIAAMRLGRATGGFPGERVGGVVVTGIAAWEPDDRALLEALHTELRAWGGPGLRVELPRLAGPAAAAFDDAIAPIADDLERRWASLPDPPEIAWRAAEGGAPSLVIAARDVEGEARAVVARVMEAMERGTPPERVAILVPDLEEARLGPLRAVLEDARVPFTEPRGRPVASCPEGRVALGLLAMAAGPVTRDQAIELLRAPGVHPGAWMDRAGAGEAMRRAVTLAHRLREVPVEVDRTGGLLVDALTEASSERPEEAWMPRALERMLKEARWVGAAASETAAPRREVARRLLATIDRIGLGRPTARELAAALGREDASEVALGSLALRALGDSAAAVRALREAVRALLEGAALVGLADAPASPAELAAELGVAARELGIGVGTAGAGSVRIARPADVAGLAHDLVMVTGLAEGAYERAEGDLALLDERMRKHLPPACRPPSAREREAWRRAELTWAMAGAERVVLSFAAGGDVGTRTHDLVRWARDQGAAAHVEPASRVAAGASQTDARGAELAALARGAPPRGEVAERVRAERARIAFFLDPREAASAYTGRIRLADDDARRRWIAAVGGDAPDRSIAVTAIERASSCSFAGFARRVLRVRRVEDLAESADHRERGTLVHRALHAAFEGARDAGSRPEAIALGRAAAERELRASATMAPLRREAVAAALADALDVLARSFEPGTIFRLHAAEQRFGPVWPALAIGGDDPDAAVVYVDGQIDRVDVAPGGGRARVVDYKTGRLPAADEHGTRVFQLPLYAAVASRVLGCEDVEAVYVSIKTRGVVDEWPRSEDDRRAFGARREEIARAARRIVLGMWDGDLGPRPAKATVCTRCEARDVCRRPAVAPIEEADDRSHGAA